MARSRDLASALPRWASWPRTPRDFWLLIQVAGTVVALRLLLPWVKLNTLLRWMEAPARSRRKDLPLLTKMARYTDAVLWRMPPLGRGPCLVRSLALYRFAQRGGMPLQLHCGVRRVGASLQGHAWLTLDGRPFLEEGDPGHCYAITFSSPEPADPRPHSEIPGGGEGTAGCGHVSH